MWILAIQNRRYWLLPGKRYTLGRTTKNKADTVDIVIQESSVSRKHLVLEVKAATDDAISHPSIRSELYVTDLGSRFGTVLDGHQLTKNEKTPTPFKASDTVPLKIGSIVVAELKWKTFVVTYSTGQSAEAHETMWNHALRLLKPLDVKLLSYVVKNTSVFVKAGTTTSSVYFALADCIPVTNSHYLQALHNAAMRASADGTTGSITPDPAPYNPDPTWKPDLRRKKCLAGQTFYLPGKQNVASLKPIIEAAGGSHTDVPKENVLCVLPSDNEVAQIPAGVGHIEITSIFLAITECRGIVSSEIRTAKPLGNPNHFNDSASNAPELQRKEPDSQLPHQSQASGRSRHTRVNFFSALTSSQPPATPQTQSSLSDNLKNQSLSNPLAQTRIESVSHGTETMSLGPQLQAPKSKRPHPDQTKKPPSKKRNLGISTSGNNKLANNVDTDMITVDGLRPEPGPEKKEEEEEDIAFTDYSKIGELAIIEETMDITRDQRSTSTEPRRNWNKNGRPNFKGFKSQQCARNSRKIEYDADIPDDAPLDDDFAMSIATRSTSPSLRTALRAGTLTSRDANYENDESLFVSTNMEDDFDGGPPVAASRHTGSNLVNELSVDGEDDGFSFRFS